VNRPSVAVAIPAYNEARGLPGFLLEIDRALSPRVGSLWLIVVDDASADETRAALKDLAPQLQATLEVITNPANRGHGPSLMTAYRRALEVDPDFVCQVDGDGQFHGSDLRRMLVLLLDDAHAVCGVRRFRQDPWFRMAMTSLVRRYLAWAFHVHARDANCPLRGYETRLLADLLASVPDDSLVPNLYLTILASWRGEALLEVDVSHRVRRGGAPEGTMFGRGRRSPIHWELIRFSFQALRESLSFRARIHAPAAARPNRTRIG
jgi:glycosyltransferase involved in cell wall biosynthesis